MIRRQHVVQDFFVEAVSMRNELDVSLRDIYRRGADWNYFCDPNMYTYLRADPRRLISESLVNAFIDCLRAWCMQHLGLVPVGLPFLHLMVNGCKLGLHSDFHNGTWGYVYSLTHWKSRSFLGGETLLLKDGVPSYKRHHVHGSDLYDLIPAEFNQLFVFDDRIVHATPAIEGSMDPVEGRIAMVGHIRASVPVSSYGALSQSARNLVLDGLARIRERINSYRDVQGTISYRLALGPKGRVESVTPLTDNVVTQSAGYGRSEAVLEVKSLCLQMLSCLLFPEVPESSSVIVPILIPIPDLSPLELTISRVSVDTSLQPWTREGARDVRDVELTGDWSGDTFVVVDPLPGTIKVDRDRVRAKFDPPMWVPSQRERFRLALTQWLEGVSTRSDA